MFCRFFPPPRFDPACQPPSPEAVFRFASFFIRAEKGRRRPNRPGRSVIVSAMRNTPRATAQPRRFQTVAGASEAERKERRWYGEKKGRCKKRTRESQQQFWLLPTMRLGCSFGHGPGWGCTLRAGERLGLGDALGQSVTDAGVLVSASLANGKGGFFGARGRPSVVLAYYGSVSSFRGEKLESSGLTGQRRSLFLFGPSAQTSREP